MNPRTVSVLGCGWLGLPLAVRLVQAGFYVKGSTTTPEKRLFLEQQGIHPYLLAINPSSLTDQNIVEFFQADILVLTLPFKRDFSPADLYTEQIKTVQSFIERSSIKWIIFTSSTSIYPNATTLAIEDQSFKPDNPRAAVLADIENMFCTNRHVSATILRLAGLYGGSRRIGQFLAGKKDLPDGDQPVNLVHLEDCVEIIVGIIQQDVRSGIFNVCADEHPTKRELYSQAARQMGLAVPQFLDEATGARKIVSNRKIKERLKYKFLHPDPMRMEGHGR